MLTMLKTADATSAEIEQIAAARRAVEILAHSDRRAGVRLEAMSDEGDGRPQPVILPAPAVRLLVEILSHIAEGRSVSIVPDDATLTTSQAAAMLHISRPYLVRLLEQKELPYSLVGTHRRIAVPDLLAYKTRRDEQSRQAVDALSRQAQELDMGY